MKQNNIKISMLTAYDYSMARIVDKAGLDVILVGDSASNVIAGHETTLPITLDQMIYDASSVVKATKRALIVVDLPFGTYQSDSNGALKSAIRIMKESGAHAVKLEGGELQKQSIERILQAGIPVMGHLGLTPQSIYKFGTYTVRAQGKIEADKLMNKNVDGQVLVVNDMLGMNKEFSPRFLRRYADLDTLIETAVKNYSDDVKKGDFPNSNEQY